MPYGQLIKTAVFGNKAIYPLDDSAEVITLDDNTATVQSVGKTDFVILTNGTTKTVSVNFAKESVRVININGHIV